MRTLRALPLLLLAAFVGLGQTRPSAPAHKRAPPAAAAKLPDPQLESAIRARLARSKIGVNHFTVRVQGGVATLEGRTEVMQHKGTATRLAKSAGATSVVNKIQISQAAKDRAADNLAKGRRRAQVKRSEPRTQAQAR